MHFKVPLEHHMPGIKKKTTLNLTKPVMRWLRMSLSSDKLPIPSADVLCSAQLGCPLIIVCMIVSSDLLMYSYRQLHSSANRARRVCVLVSSDDFICTAPLLCLSPHLSFPFRLLISHAQLMGSCRQCP